MEFLVLAIIVYVAYKLTSDGENQDSRESLKKNYSDTLKPKPSTQEYQKLRTKVKELGKSLDEAISGKKYVTISEKKELSRKLVSINTERKFSDPNFFPDEESNNLVSHIKTRLYKLDHYISTSNLNFAFRERKFNPEVFKDKNNSLTDNQSLSVVAREPNVLVVAGAGSGKTSSIVGKVKYLTQIEKVNPENILLITFSEDTKNELQQRLKQFSSVEIRTFHALGLKFLKMYEGDSDSKDSMVSKLSKSKKEFNSFINKHIDEMFNDKKYRKKLEKHFISYLKPYKSVFDESFHSLKDYVRYMRDNGIKKTLKGHDVESFEEFEISNFLYLNGINYEYEMEYKGPVPEPSDGKRRKKYRPDFYLIDYDIYIEHFAIDKDGNPPPHWFESNYVAQMEWKRTLHKNNNTRLIETYSYERMQNRLIEGLAQKLSVEGVEFKETDVDELLDTFNKNHMMNRFTLIMISFLNHFKSSEISLDALKAKARIKLIFDSSRELSFLNIFEYILNAYKKELASHNPPQIDFTDMIIKSKNYLRNDSQLKLNYQHIIVDEFQDISTATFNFLKTIRSKCPQAQLFAVGDDWQSIYQFLGSNIKFFTNFSHSVTHHMDDVTQINLSDTFRFHQNLADITSEFILQNSHQISKQIISEKKLIKDSVEIIFSKRLNLIDHVIHSISKEDSKASIMIIGRYRNPNLVSKIKKDYRNLDISYKTVHKSKGLEADYVILNNVKSGFMGFPSEIEDDPILNLVTNNRPNEKISFPEERRLFYVALTRAKKKVKIIADEDFKSSFIKEIEKNELVLVSRDEIKPSAIECKSCEIGELQLRQNNTDKSYFFGCTNYPICKRTLNYNKEIHFDYLKYYQANNQEIE